MTLLDKHPDSDYLLRYADMHAGIKDGVTSDLVDLAKLARDAIQESASNEALFECAHAARIGAEKQRDKMRVALQRIADAIEKVDCHELQHTERVIEKIAFDALTVAP